jgi:hypothetical protein
VFSGRRGSVEHRIAPTWLRVACISALGILLTLTVWSVIVTHYPGSGGGDGPFFFRLIEAGKISLGRWHELPLWNPYECGGVPLWDNPQSLVASPLILLLQPFNTSITLGVWTIFHVVLGFVGTWLLCRDELETSRAAAFVAACLFAFSSPHSNHLAGGHTAFAAFECVPLALYFWRRGEREHRFAIGLGLVVAYVFYGGGVYALAYMGLMLAVETLTRLTTPSRIVPILRAAAIVGVITGLVAAARLLPVLDQLTHYKRPLAGETDFIDWQLLKDMYLARSHALRFGHEYVWGEYIAYTGPIVVALAAIGLVLSLSDRKWLVVVGAVLLVFMLGHFGPLAPWTFLKGHVPPFTSMRVPARFRLLLILFIACWVAIAIDRLPRLLERALGSYSPVARAARVAVIGVAIFACGDVSGHSIDVINSQWDGAAPQKPAPSTRLHLGGPGIGQFIDQPRQNRGRLECWEEWAPHAGAPLWVGDTPQARMATPSAGEVYSVQRTQNSFVVDVEAREPTTLLLNTSYARGWRSEIGTPREQKNQLVVEIPAGHHRMRVWYWPVGLTAGLVLTAIGLGLAALGLSRKQLWPLFGRERTRVSKPEGQAI